MTAQIDPFGGIRNIDGIVYPTIRLIQTVVASHYQVSVLDILSKRRRSKEVWPRHVAMYLARALTPHTLPEIGRSFGGRDHTTILSAIQKMELRRAVEPEVDGQLKHLEALIASEVTEFASSWDKMWKRLMDPEKMASLK